MLENFKNISNQPAERGKILIAEPFLDDEYFKRSVIILCEHNEEGSFGFILNNIMNIDLSELIEEDFAYGFNVGLGGPVQTSNLYYLHTLGNDIEGSSEVIQGLYMGGEFEVVKEKIASGDLNKDNILFYLGYSGWSENQLEEELEKDSWVVSDIETDVILNTPSNQLWRKCLTDLGGRFKIMSNFPDNPQLN